MHMTIDFNKLINALIRADEKRWIVRCKPKHFRYWLSGVEYIAIHGQTLPHETSDEWIEFIPVKRQGTSV